MKDSKLKLDDKRGSDIRWTVKKIVVSTYLIQSTRKSNSSLLASRLTGAVTSYPVQIQLPNCTVDSDRGGTSDAQEQVR